MKTFKKRENKKERKIYTKKKHSISSKIKTEHFSQIEKEKIVQEINPISNEDIEKAWSKLKNLECKGAIAASAGIQIGNEIVDKFTLIERLHTKGHTGIDFYTFWYNRDYYKKIGYVHKMLEFYLSRNISEIRKWKYIFNLYFSSISIFRPVMAMEIYCRFLPRIAILDPTMGWGGRLVGACALDIPKYIGIDSNRNLEEPYRGLCDFLIPRSKTQIELFFQDALTVDYSQLLYDMVFTSPPYYNIEIYRKHSLKNQDKETEKKTKEEWNETFYKPLFEKTWAHLQNPGYYVLNVPQEIYIDACIPILGKASKQIALKKAKRTKSAANKYQEFIYIWQK
jgi:hypothetical protein